MKKIRMILLLALAALVCFAAAALAAPRSIIIEDSSAVEEGGQTYSSEYNLSIYDASYEISFNNDGTDPTLADLPTENLLEQFTPTSYTGNVTATVLGRLKMLGPSDYSSSPLTELPAKDYLLMSQRYSTPTFFASVKSADMVIIAPNSGDAASYDITDGDWSANFTLDEAFSLPAALYVVSFTNTPIPKYTITATAGENGTITPASADVEEGASADFTITANSGYVIESLTVDSAAVAEAADKGTHVYTFDNVTAAHTIAATFEVAAGQEKVSDVVITGSGVTLAKDPVFVASDNELVSTFDRYTGGSAELSLINDDGTASSVTFTKEEGGFVCAVTLDVSHTDDAAAVTLSLSPVSGSSFDSAKNYFAMIQKKDKSGYSIFACKHADSRLEVTVKPVGDYFTENTIAVYAGTTAATGGDTPTSDGGGSGGGCAAGIGVLALLALIPLALRRKR